jgi:hypothetical protein
LTQIGSDSTAPKEKAWVVLSSKKSTVFSWREYSTSGMVSKVFGKVIGTEILTCEA